MEVIGRAAVVRYDCVHFGSGEAFPANVVYLAPDPAEPFVALTEALAAAFPDCPPYGGAFDEPVPHLTIGHTRSAGRTPHAPGGARWRMGLEAGSTDTRPLQVVRASSLFHRSGAHAAGGSGRRLHPAQAA